MRLSQVAPKVARSVILYGAAKTGKTLIAGQLAQYFDRVIYVDMENGFETLLELPPEWQDKIELVTLRDTSSYPIAIETVLKMVKKPVVICEAHGKVACMICRKQEAPVIDIDLPALTPNDLVVFDSMTQLSASAIAHITKGEPDDYKLTFNDYGNLGRLLDIFLSHIQAANYNVIVISHEQQIEQEDKKTAITPVGGTRNFSKNISKFFGSVVYCTKKNKRHCFFSSTDYATNIITGTRSNVAIEQLEVASLYPIFRPDLYPELKTAHPTHSPAKQSAHNPETKPTTEGARTNAILNKISKK